MEDGRLGLFPSLGAVSPDLLAAADRLRCGGPSSITHHYTLAKLVLAFFQRRETLYALETL